MNELFVFWVLSLTAVFCQNAIAHSCDPVFSEFAHDTHWALIKQSESERSTEYSIRPNITLSVSCFQGEPNVAVTWDGPTPDANFYDLVGTAGNLLTQRPASEVVKYSKQCRQEALKDDSEIATIEREGIVIECQAFKRDDGGTTITIFTE